MSATDTTHLVPPADPTADLEDARRHLPLDDPDRHALDLDADARFAALAAQWGGDS